ncbi:MAG: RNA polymerase sigma factor [Sphingobacteriia bacterium]|jgi:DNA-directed RNA polymerase specialized sigma24 family protein
MSASGSTSFEELLLGLRQQEPGAQRIFFRQYGSRMLALSMRYLADRFWAEEAVSRSFEKAYRALTTLDYRGQQATLAWLKKIVVNESLMQLRAQKKWQAEVVEPERLADEHVTAGYEGDAEYLHRLVQALPTGYRLVFKPVRHRGLQPCRNSGTARLQCKHL